jgi:hypothetical protein
LLSLNGESYIAMWIQSSYLSSYSATWAGRNFWCLWLFCGVYVATTWSENAMFDLPASLALQLEVLFPEFWFISFQERLSLMQEKLNQFENWDKGTLLCISRLFISFLSEICNAGTQLLPELNCSTTSPFYYTKYTSSSKVHWTLTFPSDIRYILGH